MKVGWQCKRDKAGRKTVYQCQVILYSQYSVIVVGHGLEKNHSACERQGEENIKVTSTIYIF
jgi:hypothetical protein